MFHIWAQLWNQRMSDDASNAMFLY